MGSSFFGAFKPKYKYLSFILYQLANSLIHTIQIEACKFEPPFLTRFARPEPLRAGHRQSLNQWGQAPGNLWTNEGRPPVIFEPMRAGRRQSVNQWGDDTSPPAVCAGVPGQEMLGSRGRPAQADGGALGLGGRRPRPLLQERDAEGGPRARGHPRRLPTHLRQVQHLVSISGAAYNNNKYRNKMTWRKPSCCLCSHLTYILYSEGQRFTKFADTNILFYVSYLISAGGPEKGCFWQKGILMPN